MDELGVLELFRRGKGARFRAPRRAEAPPDFRGLYITDEEIEECFEAAPVDADPETEAWAESMRRIGERVAESRSQGFSPRLLQLAATFDLDAFDARVLLLALAPQLSPRYQKIY